MSTKMFEEIEQMILNDESTVSDLKEIKKEIEAHHLGCNIAKTTGTSVNAIGVGLTIAGIIAAPFTAGVSLGLSIGGICTSLAGGGTNLGTEITKKILLDKLRDRAKALMDNRVAYQRNTFVTVAQLIMSLTNPDTGKGFDINNLSPEALVEFIDNNRRAIYGSYTWINIARFVNMLRVTGYLAPVAVGTRSCLAIGARATELVISDCETVVSSATSGLAAGRVLTAGGEAVGTIILKTTTIALGVAFVALDTAFLVKDWMTEDALALKIQEIIDVINQDISSLRTESGL